jgi:hypothetical protein
MIGESPENPLPVKAARKEGGLMPDPTERKLTRLEGRVLELLLNPSTRHEKKKDLCELSGCGKTRFYQILKDPWFEQQRRAGIQAIVKEQAAEFVAAAAATAKMPGRDGFQDRRLLLSMSGDHIERRQHNHDVTARVVVGVVGVDMEDLG